MMAGSSSPLRKMKSPIRHERTPSSSSSSSASSKPTNVHASAAAGVAAHHPPPSPARPKVHSAPRRPVSFDDDKEPARVRVFVRVRPKNHEDLSDADSYDCVELQPELKRLKLTKNNWTSESYKFDEVFTESASQKRVYELVAKPVVESVLNGYNGTVMAYGQTGTGKTYTVGQLGKEDPSECGIMVRAMKDILATSGSFTIEVSYLQLYLESVQDLLHPEKNNIPIAEDPKTGEVSLPGATVIRVRDLDHFLHLLQIGEANRHAANTNLNTESSRSHAILMVYIQKISEVKAEKENSFLVRDSKNDLPVRNGVSKLIKSKLLVVDLAGSERIDKSGSEGYMLEEAKFINLSLTSLGKCINAIAENSPHIPTRDSKLTRLLRDSFGGSARTSLIITVGPSSRNHAETASTIIFGQRAMKIVNMVKLKEEFDYEGLCRKLESQLDHLTAELERQQILREEDQKEMKKKLIDCQNYFTEVEQSLASRAELLNKENCRLELEIKSMLGELNLQRDHCDLLHNEIERMEMSLKQSKQNHLENSTYQKVLADTTQMYEKKIAELIEELEDERARSENVQEQLIIVKKNLNDYENSIQIHGEIEIDELRTKLQERCEMHEKTLKAFQSLRTENEDLILEKIQGQSVIDELRAKVQEISQLHKNSEKEFQHLKKDNEQLLSVKIQGENEVDQLRMKLQVLRELHEKTVNEFHVLQSEKETIYEELCTIKERLAAEVKQRRYLEGEHAKVLKHVADSDSYGDTENRKPHLNGNISERPSGLGTPMNSLKLHQSKESISGLRSTVAKIFDEVGLPKIVSMLSSEDLGIQIHAVRVVANLAAEDKNQQEIVEEGGLDALLRLLGTSDNATVHRVASGAIANLAMSDMNQVLIASKGGVQLLANITSTSEDPQTLRMVAGAIANLCGNQKLHVMLKDDGGIKALLRMVESRNIDVIAQVARGMANFAKCESRGTLHGHRKGGSLLLEDGALAWLIANSTTTSASTQRHIELALCHLAQNDDNSQDFVSSGALKELVRISTQSSKEDIRNLAKKILRANPKFQAEVRRV